MTHFALICPPFQSHIRAFEALAGELVARGHRATFVLNAGGEASVVSDAVRVEIVGQSGRGPGVASIIERAGRPTGPLGILRTVRDTASLTHALCDEAPAVLRRIGADAVIGDQMEPAVGLVADHLGLRFLSLACALPIDRDPTVPPPFLRWPFDPSASGLKRNRGGRRVARLFLKRQRAVIEEWSIRFGLSGRSTMEDCISPLATMAQIPEAFDFPRSLGSNLVHVGPLRARLGDDAPLPFEIDPDRPLVYASLGTLQGHRLAMFRTVCKAARRLGVQLVVAHCGGLSDAEARALPATYVTDFLPQRSVLRHAAACITHGGLNTALDALEFGVPLLAIPIAFDQPGVAARIEHHGVGLRLSRVLLSERAVRSSLARLIGENGFGERAMALGAQIKATNGVQSAADMAERYLTPCRVAQPGAAA